MAVAKKTISDHERQKKAFRALAKELTSDQRFLFETAFQRYDELLARLKELETLVASGGCMILDAKGVPKLNPAVTAYNQTAGAADKTAQLLLKYILNPKIKAAPKDEEKEADPFDAF